MKLSRPKVGNSAKKSLKTTSLYMTSEEESPTQVQQRNIREAEMLTSNLGEGGISYQEILSDIGVLKELAILQESMVRVPPTYRRPRFQSPNPLPLGVVF